MPEKSPRPPDGLPLYRVLTGPDDAAFCLGVQWHPESDSASALDMQLFECFIQASIRHAEPLQLAG